MKLEVRGFAFAVANVWAVAGLVCAVVFKLAPNAYAGAANFLLHTDMYRTSRVVGWGELIVATFAWWILVALVAGASAALYNRSVGELHERARRGATHAARPVAG